MADYPSCIQLNWDYSPRDDLSQGDWEQGVRDLLGYLYQSTPNQTSRAVMNRLQLAGKQVQIVPVPPPSCASRSDVNAFADPVDPQAATRPGGLPERGSGLGVGGGSDVILQFAAQDWDSPRESDSLRLGDETLLHELFHALRQAMGIEDSVTLRAPFAVMQKGDLTSAQTLAMIQGAKVEEPTRLSQIYHNIEEFFAIMVTNIYRSECDRPGLVRDHTAARPAQAGMVACLAKASDLVDAPLASPLTNARNYLTVWRPQIERLCNELWNLCDALAEIDCHFNPIFELYNQKDWFLPGTRKVQPGPHPTSAG